MDARVDDLERFSSPALIARRSGRTLSPMSLAQLKDQLTQLPPEEQRKVITFLLARQAAEDDDFKQFAADRIDDKDPANWVELSELRKRVSE